MGKKKKKSKKLTEEQKRERRVRRNFNKKIVSLFETAGFDHLKTADINLHFHGNNCEIDNIFIYENIIIISEDTTTQTSNIKDHLRRKKEITTIIDSNKQEFIDLLKDKFNKKLIDKGIDLNKYSINRLRFRYLYFSKNKTMLSKTDLETYSPLKICENETLTYFTMIMKAIKTSVRYELFRYLGIEENEIGPNSSLEPQENVEYPIICPADHTAQKKGVQVVSFMLSASKLIKNGYVLRKDNWESRSTVYQRLIQKNRVKSIREYIAKNGTSFLNNVIVALPDGVQIFKKEVINGRVKKTQVNLSDIDSYGEYSITLPNRFNSLCIIDGQHRIYAHHEGNDKHEKVIGRLRENLHLLVTGLIYPEDMTEIERSAFASDVFIDINDNTKRVPAEVLLHIKTFKNPFSDVAIARMVIEELNSGGVFENRLQITSLDKTGIKTSSIIKYALKYLVTLNPSKDQKSLVDFIEPDLKQRLEKEDTEALKEYIKLSSNFINMYFSALKAVKKEVWNNPESLILRVISLNAFIMSLTVSLKTYGKQDFEFYRQRFQRLSINFIDKDEFGYASSQYRMLSGKIATQIFGD